MNRRLTFALTSVLSIGLLLSCTDQDVTSPQAAPPVEYAISDGAHSGDPNFFWLPPTLDKLPQATGPFDASALDELAVEICLLDAGGACTGPLVQRFTSKERSILDRIRVYPQLQFYAAEWATILSNIQPDKFYRARVLRNGIELGFLDVQVVKTLRDLKSVDKTRYVGIVKGLILPLWFRIQRPTALTSVKINEVESSGGTPGDWIELHNTATAPISLDGYVVRDNDDTHSYVLPAGTTIPAGGFYVVEEAALGFGLGSADAARLFTPGAATLVDSYEWATHAATTYGRCPDGSGAFQATTTVTKGAANDCSVVIRINEIESSGGTPGDWVELYNPGPVARDLAGYVFKDNDDTHAYVLPAGTIIAAGGYFLIEEAAQGFGLGSPDGARLFAPDGTTLVDSYAWTPHATTTYGRCPNGTGAFTTTTTVTKGAANDCSTPLPPVKINEIESSGGTPGDWTELYNPGSSPFDLSGYIFKDNDDTHAYVLPAGTTIAAGGYFLIEEAAQGFGLGTPDAARLFAPDGTTLVDSYAWSPHATTTYGRCPNGTGDFTTTTAATKGSANACPGEVTVLPWPGDAAVQTADDSGRLGGNMSGLAYEPSGSAAAGVLWAAKNGPGTLFRLVWDGTIWVPDPANEWEAGKALRYQDGTGDPDAEGVAFAGAGSAVGLYVATERNNAANGVSRNSILRFDATAAGATLSATNEWSLTADLPVNTANTGLEGITWISDAFLVSRGFFDESKGHNYAPAEYPNHGDGLFFVGVEASGVVYGYALNHSDNSFTRIATIASGFIGVMEVTFDRELNYLWAVCDDGCSGRTAILEIDQRPGLATSGRFVVTHQFERPGAMPNLNNEGFTVASQVECIANRKPAFWADDSATGGHAIRRGTTSCTPF